MQTPRPTPEIVFTSQELTDALRRVATATQAAIDELNAADGALGDGDIGITVSRGFREAANATLPADLGQAFLECSKAFQRVSSSSYGTLLATGFMAAAKRCARREAVPASEIHALLEAATTAMIARGKGKLGDKTVLDVLHAVAEAMTGKPERELYDAALKAASATLEAYKDRQNLLGRARMFGQRSVGRYDPGQLAMVRIVEAIGSA